MCISYWSSDVCSSDLLALRVATQQGVQPGPVLELGLLELLLRHVGRVELRAGRARADAADDGLVVVQPDPRAVVDLGELARSEELRVGTECVRTGESRWSPYHKKKNNKTHKNR